MLSFRRVFACAVVLSTALSVAIPGRGFGAPTDGSYRQQEAEIPQTPSRPDSLPVRTPSAPFNCVRYFMVDGRKVDCDSYVQQDGEHLRPVFQDVPEAISELNAYQRHVRNIKTAAYVGTGAIVAGLATFLFLRYAVPSVQPATRNSLAFALVGISLISGSYAWISIQVNERHLTNAVNDYNQSRPDRPIELMFTTGFHF